MLENVPNALGDVLEDDMEDVLENELKDVLERVLEDVQAKLVAKWCDSNPPAIMTARPSAPASRSVCEGPTLMLMAETRSTGLARTPAGTGRYSPSNATGADGSAFLHAIERRAGPR